MPATTRSRKPDTGGHGDSRALDAASVGSSSRPMLIPSVFAGLIATGEVGPTGRVSSLIARNGQPVENGAAVAGRRQLVLALQRSVGNAHVQRLLDRPAVEVPLRRPDVLPIDESSLSRDQGRPAVERLHLPVQRAPEGKGTERRQVSATVGIKWTEESDEFWRRLAVAAERQFRLHSGALVTHLLALGPSIHTRHQIKYHPPAGQLVRFHISLEYAPSQFHLDVSNLQVTGPPTAEAKAPEPGADDLAPRPDEKPAAWLSRQAEYVARRGGEYVARADANGYDRVTLSVMYTAGPAVYASGKTTEGGATPRTGGATAKSPAIFAKVISQNVEMLLAGDPRQIHITFVRDERGVMQEKSFRFEALPPAPKAPAPPAPDTRSQRERLKDYGILDPKQHWKESFEKTEETVKELAVAAVMFALKEVATMLVAGGVIKLLGAGLSRLPHLYRLIRGGKTTEIAAGLAKLTKAEADEFALLVARANRGEKLNPAELKRLEELAAKLDDALAPAAKSGQQAVTKGGDAAPGKVPTTADDAAKGVAGAPVIPMIKANINYNKPLSTAGWKSSLQGSEYGVFEGRIPGLKDPVAVKVYPANHRVFANDMAGAEIAGRTGYGPKFYGQVDEPGKQAFAMEKLPGSQIDAGSGGALAIKEAAEAATHVTKKTISDLDNYAKKMLDLGYYHIGDVQGLVDKAGRWRAIDFQSVRKLPLTKDFQARQEAIRSHWSGFKQERTLLEKALKNNPK
jgi:hypothetical protein